MDTISTTLDTYLQTLTDAQRTSLHSLNVDNKVFVDEALSEVTNNGGILPDAVNAAELRKDVEFFEQLDDLISNLDNMRNQLSDTRRLAGHEAYSMSLTAYTLYKALATAGIPGAQQSADRLGERFTQNGAGGPAGENEGGQ